MLVNISYDIEDDKTRTRLANKLKDFGYRAGLFNSNFYARETHKSTLKNEFFLSFVTI